MIRLLLGGSPCTYWSIAQKNNRETEASGIGWELFKNYLIAKEKFKPDYFLYENNVSAAQPIKDEIKKQLGVWDGTFLSPYSDVRYIEINSALVSAQNRERFYVHNCGEVGHCSMLQQKADGSWKIRFSYGYGSCHDVTLDRFGKDMFTNKQEAERRLAELKGEKV